MLNNGNKYKQKMSIPDTGDVLTAREIEDFTNTLDEAITDIKNSIDSVLKNSSYMVTSNNELENEINSFKDKLKEVYHENKKLPKEELKKISQEINTLKEKHEMFVPFNSIKKELSSCLYGLRDAVKVLEHRRDMFDAMCPKDFIEKFPNKEFIVPKKSSLKNETSKFSKLIQDLSIIKLSIGSYIAKDIKIPKLFEELVSSSCEEDSDIIYLSNFSSSLKI